MKEKNNILDNNYKNFEILWKKEKEEKAFLLISNEKYIIEIEQLNICKTENSQKYQNLESELNNDITLLKDELFNSNNNKDTIQIEVWYFNNTINTLI